MILCKDCGIPMSTVMHFEKGNNQKYNQCPKCKQETKHVTLRDNDINFGEELNKATRRYDNGHK